MPRKIEVAIVGDASSLERAFKKSSKSAKNFQGDMSKTGAATKRSFGGLSRAAGFATSAIGIAGLAGAARAAFEEMADAQKVSAQTGAVLKSTGKIANVSAKQVETLAESLMKKSGVDDEAIASGENMLLTFTKIRNEVGEGNDIFNQATKATLDLSVAMGKDMQSSAILVGKALNDPIKGVGALTRAGVQFTAEQKKMIKSLVASGQTMAAQKLILKELTTQFGGSAEAAGKTLPGKLNILRESLLNLGGTIAEKLSPSITRLVDKLVSWLNQSQNQKKVIDAVEAAASALATGVRILKTVFETLSRIVGGNTNAIKLLIGAFVAFKILTIAASVRTLAASFGLLATRQRAATTSTLAVNGALGKAGLVAAAGLAAFALTTLILKVTGLDQKLKSLGGRIYDLVSGLGLIKDPMEEFKGKLIPKPADMRFIARSIEKLMAGGLTLREAIEKFMRQHPGVARRDVEVGAGMRGRGVRVAPGARVAPGGPARAPITVQQYFQAPTTDRHREARYALNAARAVFDT